MPIPARSVVRSVVASWCWDDGSVRGAPDVHLDRVRPCANPYSMPARVFSGGPKRIGVGVAGPAVRHGPHHRIPG